MRRCVCTQMGRILNHRQQNRSLLSQTQAQLDYQQTLQQNIERRVQSLLEPTVGKGKVLVRATATLDLQHSERTEEFFDAENPAIRSEQRSSEQGGGSGFTAAGVPGVRTNVSTTGGNTQTNTGSTSSSRESETINYEVSKKVSKIVTPSGGIKQLSVAVLVDGTYRPGGRDGENVYVPRTEAELSQYREIVRAVSRTQPPRCSRPGAFPYGPRSIGSHAHDRSFGSESNASTLGRCYRGPTG